MSAAIVRSAIAASARSAGGGYRRRLTSRSDVKRSGCACRSQNRQLVRRGRA